MAETHEYYLNMAFEEAFASVRNNIGGPFGALVVREGKIIGKGSNRVTSQMDPTAHAEITAIREACRNIGTFDLSGAILYSTCEPCPMCLSAIYWANIGSVFFVSTREDAASIGFRDNHIYEELNLPFGDRKISFSQLSNPKASELFTEWSRKQDKIPY
jgi:guanine deaminase